jgi:hypothetical protein
MSELEVDDSPLALCNETELLQMARAQGLGVLRRGLPRSELVDIVRGKCLPTQEQMSLTHYTRAKLEAYIQANLGRVASQLPGCNGKCTEFGCTEGRHVLCFEPSKGSV